jgi:hypothetical protein
MLGPEVRAQCGSAARWDLCGGRLEPSGERPSLPRPRLLVRCGMFQPTCCLVASAADCAQLEALVDNGRTPQKMALRARIVLMLIHRIKPAHVAGTLGISRMRILAPRHPPAWSQTPVAPTHRGDRRHDAPDQTGQRDALDHAHFGAGGEDQRSDGPPDLASTRVAAAPDKAVVFSADEKSNIQSLNRTRPAVAAALPDSRRSGLGTGPSSAAFRRASPTAHSLSPGDPQHSATIRTTAPVIAPAPTSRLC